jgi:hypothetical protein
MSVVYIFDKYGRYIGSESAYIDELESVKQGRIVYLVPSNGTLEPVPTTPISERNSYVYDSKTGQWNSLLDVSKVKYYSKATGEEKKYEYGEQVDTELYTEQEPLESVLYQLFDVESDSWIADIPRYKEAKLSRNSTLFSSAVGSYRGSVSYNDSQWDSGEVYKRNIDYTLREYTKGTITGSVQWKDYDNQFHELTESQLTELRDIIETDIFVKGNSYYSQKWSYEQAIVSATTVQELEAIEIEYV